MFLGKLAMLLFKCPLEDGVLLIEPPLQLGAADGLPPGRLQLQQPGASARCAALGAALGHSAAGSLSAAGCPSKAAGTQNKPAGTWRCRA